MKNIKFGFLFLIMIFISPLFLAACSQGEIAYIESSLTFEEGLSFFTNPNLINHWKAYHFASARAEVDILQNMAEIPRQNRAIQIIRRIDNQTIIFESNTSLQGEEDSKTKSYYKDGTRYFEAISLDEITDLPSIIYMTENYDLNMTFEFLPPFPLFIYSNSTFEEWISYVFNNYDSAKFTKKELMRGLRKTGEFIVIFDCIEKDLTWNRQVEWNFQFHFDKSQKVVKIVQNYAADRDDKSIEENNVWEQCSETIPPPAWFNANDYA